MYQDVVEEIQSLVRQEQGEMHTALPGVILSYDKRTGRATVRPKGRIKVSATESIDYPQLNDVPVVFPFCSALAAGVAFPIEIGDSCLLIFCEQALDAWLGTGDTTSELQYSLTNAIAIPGLMKFATEMTAEAINTKSLILHCGRNKIRVGADKIVLSGNVEIYGDLSVSGEIHNEEV